jgi:hypothetical protein
MTLGVNPIPHRSRCLTAAEWLSTAMPICDGSHDRPALCKSLPDGAARFPGKSAARALGGGVRLRRGAARAGRVIRLAAANRGLTPLSARPTASRARMPYWWLFCRRGAPRPRWRHAQRDAEKLRLKSFAVNEIGGSGVTAHDGAAPTVPASGWIAGGRASATEPCRRDRGLRKARTRSRHPRRFTNN